jgi:hypothetical protein
MIAVGIAAVVFWDLASRPPATPSYAVVGIHNETGSILADVRLDISGKCLWHEANVGEVGPIESRYLNGFPISRDALLTITYKLANGQIITRGARASMKDGSRGTVNFRITREGIGFGFSDMIY